MSEQARTPLTEEEIQRWLKAWEGAEEKALKFQVPQLELPRHQVEQLSRAVALVVAVRKAKKLRELN